jgi:hypothetical protein
LNICGRAFSFAPHIFTGERVTLVGTGGGLILSASEPFPSNESGILTDLENNSKY